VPSDLLYIAETIGPDYHNAQSVNTGTVKYRIQNLDTVASLKYT